MDGNGNCTICPKKCKWDAHKNQPKKYEIKNVKKLVDSKEFKKMYTDAQSTASLTE
jgi:hypothetical protein